MVHAGRIPRPGDREAALQQRLAADYLAGQQAYNERRFDEAVSRLAAVSDQRPDYLGAATCRPCTMPISSGDSIPGAGDFPNAWEQYRRACALPYADTAAAPRPHERAAPFYDAHAHAHRRRRPRRPPDADRSTSTSRPRRPRARRRRR